MRKFLKVVASLLLGATGVLAVATAGVYWQSERLLAKTFHVEVGVPKISGDSAAIARGEHISRTRGCADCHGLDLGGAKVVDDPAMGTLYGPNITRGRGGVAADYTERDLARAIRHGVSSTGRGLVLMPSRDYSTFSDADMGDLLAYLNSAPAVDRPSVPLVVGPVARLLLAVGKIRLAATEIDHAAVRADNVAPAVSVDYGRYLAIGCTGCHGSNYSGGKIDIGPPDWPPAANLTPHASGRLAGWNEAAFIDALRTGKRPDGSSINPVMPKAFGEMTDLELRAMWKYLQTVPPVATGSR